MAGWTGLLGGVRRHAAVRLGSLGRLSHRVFHPVCQGQWAGRRRTGLRAGAAKRAGTLTRSRRRVAPRATAWLPPASVPAARSRLCAITAQPSQAQFAANSPEVVLGPEALGGRA
jgi:hypothetical protein